MDATTAKILNEISQMTQSAGWQHLKRDFENRLGDLQEEINRVGGNELKYSEGDIKKIELNLLKDLLNYPEEFTSLTQKSQESEEPDPFN